MLVDLYRNDGFSWVEHDNIHFKGYFHDDSGELFTATDACKYFAGVDNISIIKELLNKANGSFALIIKKQEIKLAATDRLRSIPLFYKIEKGNVHIFDSPEDWLKYMNIEFDINTDVTDEFLLSGFTIGNSTLCRDIFQIRPGELLVANDVIEIFKYYNHIQDIKNIESIDNEFNRIEEISRGWTKRLIESVGNRQIVLPLSGGFDSRYIAAQLFEAGFVNMIAYTYGVKDSPEVWRSKIIAEKLNIPWYFIEYTEDRFEKFLKSDSHLKYVTYAGNLASTPHYQEFIALEQLISNGVLTQNSIIVPGFCGDFLGGSYVPKVIKSGEIHNRKKKDLVQYVIDAQMYLKVLPFAKVPEIVARHIEQELDSIYTSNIEQLSAQDFVKYNDAFFAQHKVAKYVVNSLRCYEYFNLQWRMPLWDNYLMDYWYSVPFQFRGARNLYNEFLLERIFARLNIAISKPGGVSGKSIKQKIFEILIPKSLAHPTKKLISRLLDLRKRQDTTAFYVPKKYYENDLCKMKKKPIKTNNFIYIFTYWYLHKHLKFELKNFNKLPRP